MKCHKLFKLTYILLSAFLFTGCSFAIKDWNKIKDGDDIQAFEQFIQKWPGSDLKKKAEQRAANEAFYCLIEDRKDL